MVYCCSRGVHFTLAYRLYEWKQSVEADQGTIAAKLDIADRGGVERRAVQRALAAVAVVTTH